MNTSNLEELVQAAEDFIAFHRSVNLIREICQQDVNQVMEDELPKVVGKIDLGDRMSL
jgi:hypothetical protein